MVLQEPKEHQSDYTWISQELFDQALAVIQLV